MAMLLCMMQRCGMLTFVGVALPKIPYLLLRNNGAMKCPVCTTTELKMAERQGVEIDYCPQCRGVWLDRGELDKIIERSAAVEQRASTPQRSAPPNYEERRDPYTHYDDDDDRYLYNDKQHPHGKRKKSFLGDMFDIFD